MWPQLLLALVHLGSESTRSAAVVESRFFAGIVAGRAKPGDYVVCLGAGNITQWAYALPGELAALDGVTA